MTASVVTTARKLPRESRAPSSEPRQFRILAWVTLAAAIAASSASLMWSPAFTPRSLTELPQWVVLVAVASLMAVPVRGGLHFAMDLPLGLAAAYIYGPGIGGLIALVACVDPRELRRDISWSLAAFNRGQIALSVVAGGCLFGWLGGATAPWPVVMLPGVVGILADILVNSSLVVLASSAKLGLTWREALARMRFGRTLESQTTYFAFALLALPLLLMYRAGGAWGVAAFSIPLLLARQAFIKSQEALAARSSLQQSREALESISGQILDERHDERDRIASALHDDVCQALYNVTLHAQVVREDLRWGRLLALEEDVPLLVDASRKADALLREIIKGLQRSPLGPGGAAETLELLAKELQDSHGIRISRHIKPLTAEPLIQLIVYQVAREALTNAARHSGAQTIRTQLGHDGGCIRLVVEDDGRGFDPMSHFPGHVGLKLMRERVSMVGGSLRVESSSQGTVITATFPPTS